MYGYGTVEYHFGRAASARATYTCSRSHADCHLASIRRRSTDPPRPRSFAAVRGRACAGAFLRRVGDRRAFGPGRERLPLLGRRAWGLFRRAPGRRAFLATRAHRSDSRKAFRGGFGAPIDRFVVAKRRLPFGIQNKNRTAIPSTIPRHDGGPLSYVV